MYIKPTNTCSVNSCIIRCAAEIFIDRPIVLILKESQGKENQAWRFSIWKDINALLVSR